MKDELLYLFIAFFVCMLLGWLFSQIVKHKERMTLIEKGINPQEYLKDEKSPYSLGIKVGIVMIGLSIGLALITILGSAVLGHANAGPLAVLGICVGGSLVFANYTGTKKS